MSAQDPTGLRVYTLDRVAGEVARQLVVHEPVHEGVDHDDLSYRVRCVGLLDDAPWTWLDACVEGNAIRIHFPNDSYERLPPFLDLERPLRPKIGQTWRLRRVDGAPAATFLLKDITERKCSQWKYGDVVRAFYEGELLLARVIRTTESSQALVHWGVDGKFSQIPTEDIVGRSEELWTREFESDDVEIDF
jgi:hypothetical protein